MKRFPCPNSESLHSPIQAKNCPESIRRSARQTYRNIKKRDEYSY